MVYSVGFEGVYCFNCMVGYLVRYSHRCYSNGWFLEFSPGWLEYGLIVAYFEFPRGCYIGYCEFGYCGAVIDGYFYTVAEDVYLVYTY